MFLDLNMVEAAGIEPASIIFDVFIKYYQRPWKTTLTLSCLSSSKTHQVVFHSLKLSTDGADMVPLI